MSITMIVGVSIAIILTYFNVPAIIFKTIGKACPFIFGEYVGKGIKNFLNVDYVSSSKLGQIRFLQGAYTVFYIIIFINVFIYLRLKMPESLIIRHLIYSGGMTLLYGLLQPIITSFLITIVITILFFSPITIDMYGLIFLGFLGLYETRLNILNPIQFNVKKYNETYLIKRTYRTLYETKPFKIKIKN